MTKSSHDQDLLVHVAQASRQLSALFDARLGGLGLTEARGRVLWYLAQQQGPIGQGQLTAFMEVENPTAVRVLDGLEALGYIRRLPDPSDRRAKLIALTPAGRPLAEEVLRVTRQVNRAIMEGIEPADLESAMRVLSRIVDNAERNTLELRRRGDDPRPGPRKN